MTTKAEKPTDLNRLCHYFGSVGHPSCYPVNAIFYKVQLTNNGKGTQAQWLRDPSRSGGEQQANLLLSKNHIGYRNINRNPYGSTVTNVKAKKRRESTDILGFAAVKRQVLGVGNTALIKILFLYTDTSCSLYENCKP